MREDTFTNTVEDAAAYEALRGRDAYIDDTPTRAELADDGLPRLAAPDARNRPDPWQPWVCQSCGDVEAAGMPEWCGVCGFRNFGGVA